MLTVKRRATSTSTATATATATCLAYNVAYDCFCVNNDSISLRLTDGWSGAGSREQRSGERISMSLAVFCHFSFYPRGGGGGRVWKTFLISNKSKGVNNARASTRLDSASVVSFVGCCQKFGVANN